jgi:hypothetical protein
MLEIEEGPEKLLIIRGLAICPGRQKPFNFKSYGVLLISRFLGVLLKE